MTRQLVQARQLAREAHRLLALRDLRALRVLLEDLARLLDEPPDPPSTTGERPLP